MNMNFKPIIDDIEMNGSSHKKYNFLTAQIMTVKLVLCFQA